jgi:hypothetical protein
MEKRKIRKNRKEVEGFLSQERWPRLSYIWKDSARAILL